LPKDVINKEHAAILKMFSGGTKQEVMELLESSYTFRMRELQELQKAGYEITSGSIKGSYTLVKP
jgi:hypothetical protein